MRTATSRADMPAPETLNPKLFSEGYRRLTNWIGFRGMLCNKNELRRNLQAWGLFRGLGLGA